MQIREYLDRINNISSARNIEDKAYLANKVKRVTVIVTASRGGSSLFKEALTRSPELLFTSGEESPFLVLTQNEYPFTDSDYLDPSKIRHKDELVSNILDDLGLKIEDGDLSMNAFIEQMRKRLLLQLPQEDFDFSKENLENIFFKIFEDHRFWAGNYEELIRKFLIELTAGKNKPWLYYYDTFLNGPDGYFPLEWKVEDTPFVVPKLKQQLTVPDLEKHSLVFKTPQNSYRAGMFETLFPNAQIKYLHMTRGFAQSVNGLMDGWLHDKGFFAKNISINGHTLDIEGYSDIKAYGDKWWKFDLPPNWKEFKDKPLHEVCANQWASAHEHVLTLKNNSVYTDRENTNYMQLKFEDFLNEPQKMMNDVTDFIGIKPISVANLPLVMITNKPRKYRWHKRKEQIRELAKQPRIKKLMNNLNYSMEESTWI